MILTGRCERDGFASDAQWLSYGAKMLSLLQRQERKILAPASFFTPAWQGE